MPLGVCKGFTAAHHMHGENARQAAASLFFCMAPSKDGTLPIGQWNTARIICQGSVIEHWLNGERVLSFDYDDPKWDWYIKPLAHVCKEQSSQYGVSRYRMRFLRRLEKPSYMCCGIELRTQRETHKIPAFVIRSRLFCHLAWYVEGLLFSVDLNRTRSASSFAGSKPSSRSCRMRAACSSAMRDRSSDSCATM